jgi:hypothetical protein
MVAATSSSSGRATSADDQDGDLGGIFGRRFVEPTSADELLVHDHQLHVVHEPVDEPDEHRELLELHEQLEHDDDQRGGSLQPPG